MVIKFWENPESGSLSGPRPGIWFQSDVAGNLVHFFFFFSGRGVYGADLAVVGFRTITKCKAYVSQLSNDP
jgi:hypothetical protein